MSNPDTTAKADIRRRFGDLRRQDSKRRMDALNAVSMKTRPLFQALEAECGATGHRWKFDHHNWDYSVAWDICVWCGAQEMAREHPGETINEH